MLTSIFIWYKIQCVKELTFTVKQVGSVIMNLEKLVEIGLLSLYYEEDYSLGEISENLGVSRQGVYDTLKRSEKILREYENKLHLVAKLKEQEKFLKSIREKVVDIKEDLLHNRDCANLIPKLENIEEICRELLKWYLKD